MVYPALEAAEELAKEGVKAAVINVRFVKPMDEALILEWSKRGGALVTVEDGCLAGGFGSAVAELLIDRGLAGDVKLARLGYPDEYVEHGTPQELLDKYDLNAAGIAASARALLKRR
jgi:1-deoxy-D-xylulose-5-phosphate synthase